MPACFAWRAPTCRNDGFQPGAVDKGPFDGLTFDVGPVDPLLRGVVVHHRDIVDVWNGQSRHDVHVRVIYVHTADFGASHVQEEPFHRCREQVGDNRLYVVYKFHARTGGKQGGRFWPTEARLLVGRELHEVWTGAGRSAVVIDETQM